DLVARDRLLEIHAQLVGEVGAAKHLAAAAAAAAKDIAEHVAENVAETVRPEAAGPARPGANAFVSELVVGRTLLGAVQDVIGLADFLELARFRLVALVAIGVVLHGETPVRFLDVLFGRRSGYAEDVVIITFGHRLFVSDRALPLTTVV